MIKTMEVKIESYLDRVGYPVYIIMFNIANKSPMVEGCSSTSYTWATNA